jgi:hypothetical protein
MLNRDFLIGCGTVIFSLIGFFIIIPAGVVVPDSDAPLALSPAFWPSLIMLILLVSGVSILLQLILSHLKKRPVSFMQDEETPLIPDAWRLLLVIPGLFIYYLLIDKLGILLSSVLLLIALMLLGGERRFWPISLVAILLPTLLYYFFTLIGNAMLPMGIFDN